MPSDNWQAGTISGHDTWVFTLFRGSVCLCVCHTKWWINFTPKVMSDKLQWVLNAAAHVVSGTHRFDRGLSRLLHTELDWLDVCERVVYKVGVMPSRSSTSVLRWIVSNSHRCRITATSPIRHPTAPSRTMPPAQRLWLMGFLCGWSVGLEFPARQLVESGYWWEQFQSISEDVSVWNVLMHSVH